MSCEWVGGLGFPIPGLSPGDLTNGMQPQPGSPLLSTLSQGRTNQDVAGSGSWGPWPHNLESMVVPIMLLNLVEVDKELAGNHMELRDWCAQGILKHVQVGAGG